VEIDRGIERDEDMEKAMAKEKKGELNQVEKG
jgi:hypothetical protein